MLILHIILTWAALLCSIWLIGLIDLICGLLIAPRVGMQVSSISFFGNNFVKNMNGKWNHSRGRFSLLLNNRVTIDLNNTKNPFRQEKKWTVVTIETIIMTIISLALVYFFLPSVYRCFHFEGSYLDTFLAMLGIVPLICTIVVVLHTVSQRSKDGKSLEWYIDVLLQRVRDGEPFSSLDLRPIDQLPYKTSSTRTRDLYNRLYMMYLIWERRTEEMPIPMNDMTANMRASKSFSLADTGTFYTLVFYYSRYKYDPVLAKEFLDRVRDRIAADSDANARRILAYYAYCIEGDRQKARVFLNQAAKVADIFSVGSERELEKRLIAELDLTLKEEGF